MVRPKSISQSVLERKYSGSSSAHKLDRPPWNYQSMKYMFSSCIFCLWYALGVLFLNKNIDLTFSLTLARKSYVHKQVHFFANVTWGQWEASKTFKKKGLVSDRGALSRWWWRKAGSTVYSWTCPWNMVHFYKLSISFLSFNNSPKICLLKSEFFFLQNSGTCTEVTPSYLTYFCIKFVIMF